MQRAFEERRDADMERLRGRDANINRSNGGALASSVTHFAMGAFWLDDQVTAANTALLEYANFFIHNRQVRNDQHSLYWTAELTARIISMYGRNGTVAPGRLEAEVEDRLLELMWIFISEHSYVDSWEEVSEFYANTVQTERHAAGDPMPVSANIINTRTWDIIESENHHVQTWMTIWDFTRLLAQEEAFRDREVPTDGHTVAEHYQAWTDYAQEFMRERAKRGLFVEMADDTYNSLTLKGVYNMVDFADDPVLQQLAANLLTLYYATWAEEQLDGVHGGGKSRIRGAKDRRSITAIRRTMWYYAGIGGRSTPHGLRMSAVTSGYRLPDLVVELATRPADRGVYEVVNPRLGLAYAGHWTNPHYRLNPDNPGVLRYTYATPEFIMGIPMVPAIKNTQWTKISSQSRWQGVIFAGDNDARIFVQTARPSGSSDNNQQYGVQRKGTMITQRLRNSWHAAGTDATRVWVSDNGLSKRIEEGGWVFVEAPGAYAAVRPSRGGFTWEPAETTPRDGSNWSGNWMLFDEEYAPAILEVARKSDFASYEDFRSQVLARPLRWDGEVLHYESLNGDAFVFHADNSQPRRLPNPTINGEGPNYHQPEYAFKSPFIHSEWASGIVKLRFMGEELTLDFTLGEKELHARLDAIRAAREAEQRRIEAVRPRVTAEWISPNSAFVALDDPANWTSDIPPMFAGDHGEATGTGPIRIALPDNSVNWLGTLIINNANLTVHPNGSGGTLRHMVLDRSNFIWNTDQSPRDRHLGDANSVFHLQEGGAGLHLNGSARRKLHFFPNTTGPGALTVNAAGGRAQSTVSMRGTIAHGGGTQIVGGLLELLAISTYQFAPQPGGNVGHIAGTGASARLLAMGTFAIDLAGVAAQAQSGQQWTLVDWASIPNENSGFTDSFNVRSGEQEWQVEGETPFMKNAPGSGRTWTLQHEGRSWTFNEASGILSVQ